MMSKTVVTAVFYLVIGFPMVFGQTNIKVMTFNVRYDELFYNPNEPSDNDWTNRKDAQVGLIDFQQPDVVGMQEPLLHQVKYFHKALTGYKWVGIGREDGNSEGELNPIFYNEGKVELISANTFWLSETPEEVSKSWDAGYTRICTWALFELKKSKHRFYVFNTHFDSKGAVARLESARLINKKIKSLDADLPVFVTGDFNFDPNSSAYTAITEYGLLDSKKICKTKPYGPEGTFNGFQFNSIPKYRIDYVFVNKLVKIMRYGVLTDNYEQKFPSDHLPVMVIAEFPE